MIDRFLRYLSAISFQRGLVLGAMVGAAIAGSTLWARIRDVRQRPDDRERPLPRPEPD